MKATIAFVALFLFMISFASAQEQQTLGTFAQNSPINLTQTCANCSFVNLTFIKNGDGALYTFDTAFTKSGSSFNYTLLSNYTSSLGEYIINWLADPNGLPTSGNYNLFVTPSGRTFDQSMSLPVFIPMILMAVLTLALFFGAGLVDKKEYKLTMVILSGIFLVMAIGFGIVASRDILWGFPQIYNLINIFYRIFIITVTVAAIVTVLITAFYVIKRTFSRKGYVIEERSAYYD